MCGIVGVAGALVKDGELVDSALRRAISQLKHRGPDGSGISILSQHYTAFGHTRLSVLDLSQAASQPMFDREGNCIVYNGEIYNFEDLRENHLPSLESNTSTGDTAVLLEACSRLGVPETLRAIRGMYAFAFLDVKSRELYLARDRFGEKPLYYQIVNGTLVFGSELKALLEFALPTDLSRDSIANFLRFQYTPPGRSVFENVRQVRPGHFVRIKISELIDDSHICEEEYWSARQIITNRRPRSYQSLDNATDELIAILGKSVKSQMISDVPVGAFLSGGIDSSLIVALMKEVSPDRVHTFSIGFSEDDFDESAHAKSVADHLETIHTEFKVTASDALSLVNNLAFHFDDPFGDSSQIPTLLLSELTKRYVTVALSGDGGDELFGGYNRYFLAPKLWKVAGNFPPLMRRSIYRAICATSPSRLDRFGRLISLGGRVGFSGSLSSKARRLGGLLDSSTFSELYLSLISHWQNPPVLEADLPRLDVEPLINLSIPEQLMYWDTITYLPSDILVKVDRAAMANSLETRAPFLDPELFEFAWNLPSEYRIARGTGKIICRNALDRYVPRNLWNRPKQGFGVPIGSWLRADLLDWASNLLYDPTLDYGLLDNYRINQIWLEHLSGEANNEFLIWDVLMLKLWIKQWIRNR